MKIDKIDKMIASLEKKLAELYEIRDAQAKADEEVKKQIEEEKAKSDSLQELVDMYKNSIGKTIDNKKKPLVFVSGMYCVANLWYKKLNEEGEYNLYACYKTGLVTDENFEEYMIVDIDEDGNPVVVK